MYCSEDENVCSVKKENNLGYYRLHTIWRKNGFFINITSKNGAWRGEMTPNDIAKMSAQLDMEPEAYLKQCKEALTCHDGRTGMVYAVEDGCFAWKKVEDEDSGIKIKMGSVMLEPTNFADTIQNLVTAALNCNKNLQENIKELTKEKEKILENKNELLNKLDKLVETKETMENDLYERFIVLINAKKRKILELENLLEDGKKNKHSKYRNSSYAYEIDTDNDSDEFFESSKNKKVKKKGIKSKNKNVRCGGSAKEATEEKRLKNNDEDTTSDKSDFNCYDSLKCISPLPGISKGVSENDKKVIQQTDLTTTLTNDELYDYFYGEL